MAVITQHISCVRKNEVDFEDLKNEVYYSIAVARHTKHLGFTSVRMNPEHSNLQPFILLLSSQVKSHLFI